MQKILVTGGAGYIGSHTVVALLQQGYETVIVDNFSNSHPRVLDRIAQICGQRPGLVDADLRDANALDAIFQAHDIAAVIHFAGLKAVGESVADPVRYYDNNVQGALQLINVMSNHGCHRLVFSSSATVYGNALSMPINEQAGLQATNPYGWTKLMIEQILRDTCTADSTWRVALLRYFNPVAAHESGLIGEDPNGIPNNLVPFVAQVAVGRREHVAVFGDDYDTPDGTGVRDYIHVQDLADAHLSALRALDGLDGCRAFNIGTGNGHSVLEVIRAFSVACGHEIPYQVVARRPGDVATSYADVSRSRKELGWQAKFDLPQMMQDHWRWQSRNPKGYGSD
ncbi:UDP-glucose 4-epimerase GalE [Arenicella chitinivorans]|uniref:UDP-glucose 4-epimerase n=1 Tax=Arenicella chitinivorans TaxID=1329800 RepID=A0A918VJW0_9GAMM|nr:UDP-glucose 4-epimerase GalE [Arenicella chitinivorans]GHA03418.1 UDP-glucose 4-epimerase GalE [Arenicella chitinivorans]